MCSPSPSQPLTSSLHAVKARVHPLCTGGELPGWRWKGTLNCYPLCRTFKLPGHAWLIIEEFHWKSFLHLSLRLLARLFLWLSKRHILQLLYVTLSQPVQHIDTNTKACAPQLYLATSGSIAPGSGRRSIIANCVLHSSFSEKKRKKKLNVLFLTGVYKSPAALLPIDRVPRVTAEAFLRSAALIWFNHLY